MNDTASNEIANRFVLSITVADPVSLKVVA
jgi:hypothetical protein